MTGQHPECWLAQFTDTACDGRLVRAHLLPRRLLKQEFRAIHRRLAADERSFVLACGGPMGNAGHHGALDVSRTLRVPFDALPQGLIEMASELDLLWWVEREYQTERKAA